MSPARRVTLLAVAAYAVAIGLGSYAGWGSPALWAVPVLALGVAASELAVVHLMFGRERWSFSCTDGAIGAALVLAGGAWAALAVCAGVAIAQCVRRQPRLKIGFNVGQFAASTAAAVAMSQYVGGGLPGACAGMGMFWVVNHVLVGCAVAFTSGRRLQELLWDSAPMSALHTAGNTSMGLLAAWLSIHAPLGLLGLVVPMALLWWSYDQQTCRAAEARLFAELARGQERASGQSSESSARVVLTAAARLFGGADCELLVLGVEGPVRYLGDEYGVSDRARVEPSVLGAAWALRLLGSGGVITGSEHGRPYCSALLGPRGAPLALLHAVRAEGAAGFGRRDTTLAQVLVGQAESWLSVAQVAADRDRALDRAEAADSAARALGDIGADNAVTLAVLRESAGRLANLVTADLGPGEVDEIVSELHAVERAVAALLGAIALNAEPGLRTVQDDSPPAPARAEPAWTTTGVLELR